MEEGQAQGNQNQDLQVVPGLCSRVLGTCFVAAHLPDMCEYFLIKGRVLTGLWLP